MSSEENEVSPLPWKWEEADGCSASILDCYECPIIEPGAFPTARIDRHNMELITAAVNALHDVAPGREMALAREIPALVNGFRDMLMVLQTVTTEAATKPYAEILERLGI